MQRVAGLPIRLFPTVSLKTLEAKSLTVVWYSTFRALRQKLEQGNFHYETFRKH